MSNADCVTKACEPVAGDEWTRSAYCLLPTAYCILPTAYYLTLVVLLPACPLKVRVGANSPSLCPTMFSLM